MFTLKVPKTWLTIKTAIFWQLSWGISLSFEVGFYEIAFNFFIVIVYKLKAVYKVKTSFMSVIRALFFRFHKKAIKCSFMATFLKRIGPIGKSNNILWSVLTMLSILLSFVQIRWGVFEHIGAFDSKHIFRQSEKRNKFDHQLYLV